MVDRVSYLSFGGGPPSVALAILNATGQIRPRADFVIFADTGAEKQATYDLIPVYREWLSEFGITFHWIQSQDGSLTDWITNRSVAIPAHGPKGMGHRQCTDQFKIRAIRSWIKSQFGNVTQVCQLAMTWDEALRAKDSQYRDTFNDYPLIDMKIRRDEAVAIIERHGLPIPPWSACYFCPLQNHGTWQQIASNHPEEFEKAVLLDAKLAASHNRRLHWSRKPLAKVYSSDQLSFDVAGGACDSGYCFT